MKINILLTLFFAAALFLLAGCAQTNPPKACTEEAKLCPDGTAVGRIGPNCEFAPCPNTTNCQNYSVANCPGNCVICPPCAACSSISCQSEEFCSNIGFNRSWYNETNPNCVCPQGYIREGDACNPVCYYSTPKCLMPSIPCDTAQKTAEGEACVRSGGNITTQICCKSVTDFPNTCLIGACGCSPDNSHEIKACDCGEGKCWDSNKSECINPNV